MAQKRMFDLAIVRSDKFLDMSPTAQLLYFHLGMNADDDGFVSPKLIMRMLGTPSDDLKILIAKEFVIPFEDGVVVIKDWKNNNLIRSDRYKPTIYQDHLKRLSISNSNGYILLGIPTVNQMETHGIPSIEESREVESSRVKNSREDKATKVATTLKDYSISVVEEKKYSKIEDITETEIQQIVEDYNVPRDFVLSKIDDIKNYTGSTGKKYKNYFLTLRNWTKKDAIKFKMDIYKKTPITKGAFHEDL